MTKLILRARKTLLVSQYPNALYSIIKGRHYRLDVESEEADLALLKGLIRSGLFELVAQTPEMEVRGSLPLGVDFLEAIYTMRQI